jgi:hypothetical protein
MHNVRITKRSSGRLAAEIAIELHGTNYTPTQEQYYAKAWGIAVVDRSVDSERKGAYQFELVEAPFRLGP